VARVAERSKVSPEEYLAWERQQPSKHEYFDGEVFAMSGASPRHNRLSVRICVALELAVGKTCNVFTSDQRLRTGRARYVYPDAVVVCGKPTVEHDDVITNPTVVVEVLSSSTEQYDRGLKWDGYQSRESLTDYVLVSQDRARIEHFGRKDAQSSWTYTAAGAGQVITLVDGTVLDVDAIFAGVFELKGDDAVVLGEEA
jgi:Uma2 family endonuclease